MMELQGEMVCDFISTKVLSWCDFIAGCLLAVALLGRV